MNIKQYLDSTYLKTAEQAGISEADSLIVNTKAIQEAIDEDFKLIMIRPEIVSLAKKMISEANSSVLIGTVIDFPEGKSSIEEKLKEAAKAVEDQVDELDYVVNYEAFKAGNTQLIKDEIIACTNFGLQNHKAVKYIIEVAALTDDQIIQISALIKNTVIAHFSEKDYHNIFVKSSTGFYKTTEGKPNGATVHTIKLMLENSEPLPVKAAGGVRTLDEAIEMVNLGVKRIGTSGAKAIADGQSTNSNY